MPAGGAYCRCTLTCVLRPPRAVSKFTEPAVTTSEPGSDRHADDLVLDLVDDLGVPLDGEAGRTAATQCDLPSEVSVTRSR